MKSPDAPIQIEALHQAMQTEQSRPICQNLTLIYCLFIRNFSFVNWQLKIGKKGAFDYLLAHLFSAAFQKVL